MPLTGDALHKSARNCQRVLVTGAAGFIGSRIVDRLLAVGYSVIATVRSKTPDRIFRLHSLLSQSGLQIAVCNLHDQAATEQMIARFRPEACVHAAWDVSNAGYRDHLINQRWVRTSLHMLNALVRAECRWIGVLGTCIEPLPCERPCCRYAAAKATLRHQLLELATHNLLEKSVDVCWWRVFQPYGPGEPTQRFIPSLIDHLLRRECFTMTSADSVRDFIHVDDAAAAVSASLSMRLRGTFDLGTGAGHRIGDVAEFIASCLGAAELIRSASSASVDRPDCFIANPQALSDACGWRPQYDLHTTLRSQIEEARLAVKAIA